MGIERPALIDGRVSIERERCYSDELMLSGREAAAFSRSCANAEEHLTGIGADLQATRFLGSGSIRFLEVMMSERSSIS
jgi:hypothetical protein